MIVRPLYVWGEHSTVYITQYTVHGTVHCTLTDTDLFNVCLDGSLC